MPLAEQVQEAVDGLRPGEQKGRTCYVFDREQAEDVFAACRRAGFDYLANLTAVDWIDGHPADEGDPKTPVFEVAYNLYSLEHNEHLALQCLIPRDDPRVPSATPTWKAADWHEREMYDLMGITFEGHPDLRRIMMPEDWDGHPLRKDYDLSVEQFIYRENGEDRVTKDPTRGW